MISLRLLVNNEVCCDVDGVVADLVGGLQGWLLTTYGVEMDRSRVVYHNDMGRSPGIRETTARKLMRFFPSAETPEQAFSFAFEAFMKDRDVYGRYIPVIPGALEGIAAIQQRYEVVFVTALMKKARDHFRSKMEWIERWFPGCEVITATASKKRMVRGRYAIDDRYDTCAMYRAAGTEPLLFEQPWNEVPDGVVEPSYDWKGIVQRICDE
jgi:5'(3')-deoxyribonucleotidase